MGYSCVVFDLDGTLLDTLDDLMNAVNHALVKRGGAPRTRDEIRRFVGNGVANLLARALPEDANAEELDSALEDFRAYYDKNLDVETRAYPGVCELLKKLRGAGVKCVINSNKYDAAVQRLCSAHFPGLYLKAVGESADVPKKPSSVGVETLLGAAGVYKRDALYVGDSAVDIQTAKNAGLEMAWVSWGFRTRAEIGERVNAFDDAESLYRYITKTDSGGIT